MNTEDKQTKPEEKRFSIEELCDNLAKELATVEAEVQKGKERIRTLNQLLRAAEKQLPKKS